MLKTVEQKPNITLLAVPDSPVGVLNDLVHLDPWLPDSVRLHYYKLASYLQ